MAETRKIRQQFSSWVADEFQPSILGASLLSSILIYFVEIILAISFTALVFSGGLSGLMPQGIGFIVIGDAAMLILIALLSSYPGSISTTQSIPAAVLALSAAAIAAAPGTNPAQQFATVVMAVVITTLATGLFFLLLGTLKLGGLMRFLPYPVMGGFLAGSGWLLVKGGISIMANAPVGMALLESRTLMLWLPGVLVGVLIFIVASRYQETLSLPILLGLSALVFYMVVFALGIPFSTLAAQGWVVGGMPGNALAHYAFSPDLLSQVDWVLLFRQIPNLAPVAVISIIALLLNCGGLELLLKKDMDLNRELVAAGVGNLVSGLLGGPVGYQAISLTTLNFRVSNGKRLPGMLAALLVAATIFLGAPLLMYVPKLIVGAVLVYLGLGMLIEWIYRAWFKFPLIDFIIILSILSVIIFIDFLSAIFLGLVLAIIMFVISYSQVSVVKFELMGKEYRSRVVRNPRLQSILAEHGNQLYIMRLQGFIFFGTANSIFNQVRDQIQKAAGHEVRFFLLDFNHVSGLDSTGMFSFTRLMQMAEDNHITVAMTGLRGRTLEQFERNGFKADPAHNLRFFPDMDRGIEWCEDQIIAGALDGDRAGGSLVSELASLAVGQQALLEKLVAHMHRIEFQAGEYLIRQGDQPEMIYFIETGQVSVQHEMEGRAPTRLETTHGGRPVGELGFYMNIPRTAAVVAEKPSVAYALSTAELAELEKNEPAAANLFHRIVMHFVGERLIQTSSAVVALER